jgi:hypothetical protein
VPPAGADKGADQDCIDTDGTFPFVGELSNLGQHPAFRRPDLLENWTDTQRLQPASD